MRGPPLSPKHAVAGGKTFPWWRQSLFGHSVLQGVTCVVFKFKGHLEKKNHLQICFFQATSGRVFFWSLISLDPTKSRYFCSFRQVTRSQTKKITATWFSINRVEIYLGRQAGWILSFMNFRSSDNWKQFDLSFSPYDCVTASAKYNCGKLRSKIFLF